MVMADEWGDEVVEMKYPYISLQSRSTGVNGCRILT